MVNFISPWLYPVIWMALIFLGSSITLKEGISPVTWADKAVHFVEYGILGILFFYAFYKKSKQSSFFIIILISVFLSTVYGLSDEIHQIYVPTREFDLADLAADFCGSLFFCLVYCFYLKRRAS